MLASVEWLNRHDRTRGRLPFTSPNLWEGQGIGTSLRCACVASAVRPSDKAPESPTCKSLPSKTRRSKPSVRGTKTLTALPFLPRRVRRHRKTTLAKHFAASMNGVSFCAFTGKAALVMRQKDASVQARFILLIYTFDTEAPPGTMRFIRNALSPLLMANLVIVDECSMVNCQLGEDLLSFGKRCSCSATLPSFRRSKVRVSSLGEPDFLLTEIHRQAAENPIIRLSQIVREGGKLKQGKYGDSAVIPQSKLDWQALAERDQVLVGHEQDTSDGNREDP